MALQQKHETQQQAVQQKGAVELAKMKPKPKPKPAAKGKKK
jgi:hypothetical protein